MTRSRRVAFALIAVHAAIGVTEAAISARPMGDFLRYWTVAIARGRPYVDYPVEFAPGTVLVFKTIAAAGGGQAAFSLAIVLLNIAADMVIARALWLAWGCDAAVFYLAAALPMLPIVNYRTDLWPTACAVLAVAAWRRQKPIAGAIALLAGTALKLWPAALAMSFGEQRPHRRTSLLASVAVAAVIATWLGLASTSGVRQVATFREAQGWEIESTVGAVWLLEDPRTLRIESGAWRVGSIAPDTSLMLFAIAAPLTAAAMWLGARKRRQGAAWIAGVGILLVSSPLFSAQYIMWIVPAAAIAWIEDDRLPAILVAIATMLTCAYFATFHAALDGNRAAVLLIVARNVVVIAATITAASAIIRPARPSTLVGIPT
jgi:hypothetical protein